MDSISVLIQSALARQSAGDINGAIEIYRRILQLRPASLEALCNLGSIFHAAGELPAAVESYRKALASAPAVPQIHYNLAGALQALGRVDEAGRHLARALALKPDYPEALFAAGNLGIQAGDCNVALEHFRKLLVLAPGHPDALNGIGLCFKHLGNSAQALAHFRQALRANPDHYEALANLAVELLAQGATEESIQASQRALTLNPGDPKLLYNLGLAHKQNKAFTEAIDCLREALTADHDAVYMNHDAVYMKIELSHTLQSVCDWRDEAFSLQAAARLVEQVLDNGIDIDVNLFNALSLPLDAPTLLQIAKRKSRRIAHTTARYTSPLPRDGYTPATRLRVGYLSPDYRNHPAVQLMGGLFKAHDRDKLEVFAYSIGPDDGSRYRRRTEQDAEHFVDLYAETLATCIERIRSDRIHILVDLAGYTTGARPEIPAARVAPVQVNWLGFPGTLGAEFFDYLITDAIVTPTDDQPLFTEKFALLPHCYQINDDREKVASETPDRDACGLPPDAFVFCCFNNNYKIDAAIFSTWMQILHKVPGSVLWLLKGSELQMYNLRNEADRLGIDAGRLIFAEPLDKAAHLARHAHAELFLDTLYYNAHTTGSDALRQGVPMITCPGARFASRVGASLLHAVGLDKLVVDDLETYIDKAVQLASRPDELQAARDRLVANLAHTSLLDNPRFARNLENLYETMWERCKSGKDPALITTHDT